MKQNRISPDDPKLTAYALGELEGNERAEIEAAVANDGELRAAVERVREFSAQLKHALAGEPEAVAGKVVPMLEAGPSPDSATEVAVVSGADARLPDGGPAPYYGAKRSKILQFPQLYYVIAGVAAAGFAIVFAFHEEKPRPEVKYYQEILLKPESQTAALPRVEDAATEPAAAEVSENTSNETTENIAPRQVASAPAIAATPPAPAASAPASDSLSIKFGLLDQAKALSGRPVADAAVTGPPWAGMSSKSTIEAGRFSARPRAQLTANGGYVKNGIYYYPADPKFVVPVRPIPGRTDRALPQAPNPVPPGAFDLLPGPAHRPAENSSGESYAYQKENPFVRAAESPRSSFGIDVDTASYANVRRFVDGGRLPPVDAVKIEELLNYFPYADPAPSTGAAAMHGGGTPPFQAALEVADAPWAPTHRLVRIGMKARDVSSAQRPAANLVFLLDVSGSMDAPNKLPLVKESMRLLLSRLRPDDRVAIVTYAGVSGLALPSTPVAKLRPIVDALDALTAGGSTNGSLGIQLAYDIARANFVSNGINRVILCTDGDFNVGVTGQGELARLVSEKARSGVALTVLGFGMGDYKDTTLETLAANGNGNYGYIDTKREAEKQLVQEVNGTLLAVARNVKVQVDFNPAQVASYRLIGYEDRVLPPGSYQDDGVAAGEVGAGDAVTALYEVVPVGAPDARAVPASEPSRYATVEKTAGRNSRPGELLTLKIRYQDPNSSAGHEVEIPLVDRGGRFADATSDFKFAAAVAEYGMILRDSPNRGNATMGDVISWATAGASKPADDPGGYRSGFINLARRTQALLQ